MKKDRINIALIGHPDIIYEGISNLLHRQSDRYYLYRIDDIEELDILTVKTEINIAVLNPENIINRVNQLRKFRNSHPAIYFIALVYSLTDNRLLNEFDSAISITDTSDMLRNKIDQSRNNRKNLSRSKLSDRENDILIQLVRGLSNKEIADKLNISIHTVISHRKNISEKTGIKSLPGLTIYAISNKLIPLSET